LAGAATHDVPHRWLARGHALRGRGAKAVGDEAAARDHFRVASGDYQAAVAAAPDNKKLREEAAEVERLLAE
jgi:hypothetical protein